MYIVRIRPWPCSQQSAGSSEYAAGVYRTRLRLDWELRRSVTAQASHGTKNSPIVRSAHVLYATVSYMLKDEIMLDDNTPQLTIQPFPANTRTTTTRPALAALS